MAPSKKIRIIAGPNGAGKTTFATEFLLNEGDCPTFVNADMIAAGLNPFAPERSAVQAGRLMLRMIDDYVSRGREFRFRNHAERSGVRATDSDLADKGILDSVVFSASADAGYGFGAGAKQGPGRGTSRAGRCGAAAVRRGLAQFQ